MRMEMIIPWIAFAVGIFIIAKAKTYVEKNK